MEILFEVKYILIPNIHVNTIVDVDSGEAEKLLKLIELLIDKWYIARHDEEQLLSDITAIADDKDFQKKSSN